MQFVLFLIDLVTLVCVPIVLLIYNLLPFNGSVKMVSNMNYGAWIIGIHRKNNSPSTDLLVINILNKVSRPLIYDNSLGTYHMSIAVVCVLDPNNNSGALYLN